LEYHQSELNCLLSYGFEEDIIIKKEYILPACNDDFDRSINFIDDEDEVQEQAETQTDALDQLETDGDRPEQEGLDQLESGGNEPDVKDPPAETLDISESGENNNQLINESNAPDREGTMHDLDELRAANDLLQLNHSTESNEETIHSAFTNDSDDSNETNIGDNVPAHESRIEVSKKRKSYSSKAVAIPDDPSEATDTEDDDDDTTQKGRGIALKRGKPSKKFTRKPASDDDDSTQKLRGNTLKRGKPPKKITRKTVPDKLTRKTPSDKINKLVRPFRVRFTLPTRKPVDADESSDDGSVIIATLNKNDKSQKKKSKYNPPKRPKTKEGPPTKRIVGSRNRARRRSQRTEEEEQQMQEERAQIVREGLNEVNARIARFDNWQDPPPNDVEIDLFEDDPLYFVHKKIPDATSDLLDNMNHVNQRMYEPCQYDYERAKMAVTAVTQPVIDRVQFKLQDYQAAFQRVEFMEKKKAVKSNRFKHLKEKVATFKQRKILLKSDAKWQATLLPYDSVYALRSAFNNDEKRIEYFAISKNPDGSFKEKIVTRDWLKQYVEQDFLDRFFKSEKEKGWIYFSSDEADLKSVKDDESILTLVQSMKIRPFYVYKPRENDDKIHCVRVGVDFRYPYQSCIPESYQWAIMTERQTLTGKQHEKKNPWNIRDKGNATTHIYHECTEGLLIQAFGEILFGLIKDAIEKTFKEEARNPGHAYLESEFVFDEEPYVAFIVESKRYIDSHDYSKSVSSKKYTKVFHEEYCGHLSNRQYYYFDLRKLETEYFINVSTRQISGLLWNTEDKIFVGLEKFKESGVQRFNQVRLDADWVSANFEEDFLRLVKSKAEKEQHRFVKLPVGKGRPQQKSQSILKNPRIAYPQFGMDTCIFASICSALYYLKFEDVAYQIDTLKMNLLKESSPVLYGNLIKTITQFIKSESPDYFRKCLEIQKIEYCDSFDLLDHATRKPNILYHVVIESEDGAGNHSICVVHKWIFDGNYTNALPLSKQNLDNCCGDSIYVGISTGYKYFLPKTHL
jgi:hypothetical protein